MKKVFLLATIAATILVFPSCKKDKDETPAPTEKKLKKVTRTEGGVVTVFNLTYNAAGKLVSFKSTDNKEWVLFSYDTQGNLTGIDQQDQDFHNIYAYTYAGNKPVTGTLKSWDISNGQPGTLIEDDQLAYTVTNDQVSKIVLTMLGGGVVNLNMTYANGGLSKVVSEGVIPYIAEFTYGTKKAAYPKVTNYVLDQAGFSLLFASSHEILTASLDFAGTNNDVLINNNYTYNSEGYVLTRNDGTTIEAFEYQ